MDEISRPLEDEAGPPAGRRRAKGPADALDEYACYQETDEPGGRGDCAPKSEGEPDAEDAGDAGDAEVRDAEVRDADAPPPLTDPDELARVVLALLLVAREPVSLLRLAQVCGASQQDVERALALLESRLREQGFPIEVSRIASSVRLLTLPEVFPYVERLRGAKKAERLSPAALETLAVVAYRQPVIRAEIEAIRGVKVGPTLRTLLEHKLVGVVGRADVPGRPLQYGTTQQFLDRFGVASLKDLPSVKEFKSLG